MRHDGHDPQRREVHLLSTTGLFSVEISLSLPVSELPHERRGRKLREDLPLAALFEGH
jgi:hypothetical protein